MAIQKEDLPKYHNRDTWFQLQHVDADSEVQVRLWFLAEQGSCVLVMGETQLRVWGFSREGDLHTVCSPIHAKFLT